MATNRTNTTRTARLLRASLVNAEGIRFSLSGCKVPISSWSDLELGYQNHPLSSLTLEGLKSNNKRSNAMDGKNRTCL
jgi:hypothetical protein